MLRQLDEAVVIARQDRSDIKGRVTLGLAPTTAAALGMPLIRQLRARHPGIDLSIVSLHSGYLEEMARAGQLDVAIMFSHSAASEMTLEPLLEEELFVLVSADSDLVPRDKTSLSLNEIARMPLALPRAGHGLRRRVDLELDRAQLTVREPVAEIDSLLLLMQYVAEGAGVTIQPMSAMLVLEFPGRWRCLSISQTRMLRTNYLYALPPDKISTTASTVRAELKNITNDLVSSGIWRGVRLVNTESLDTGTDSIPKSIAEADTSGLIRFARRTREMPQHNRRRERAQV